MESVSIQQTYNDKIDRSRDIAINNIKVFSIR